VIPLAHDAAALRAQEGEHGEDPAIVFRCIGEPELVEDPADVTLDALFAEEQPLADG
jgi:hypothetical protein